MDWLLEIDRSLFLAINGCNSGFLDSMMVGISSRIAWIPIYLLLAYFMFREFGWKGLLGLGMLVALGVLISDQVSSSVLKPMVERLRPCHAPELAGLVHVVNGKCGGEYGFVSSHAANFGFLAAFTWGILKRSHLFICISMTLAAILVGYSRIYLGVHYPLDILGGYLVGIMAAVVIWIMQKSLAPYFAYIQR